MKSIIAVALLFVATTSFGTGKYRPVDLEYNTQIKIIQLLINSDVARKTMVKRKNVSISKAMKEELKSYYSVQKLGEYKTVTLRCYDKPKKALRCNLEARSYNSSTEEAHTLFISGTVDYPSSTHIQLSAVEITMSN